MEDPFNLVPPDIKERYQRADFVDRAQKAGRLLEKHLQATFGREMEVVFVRHDIDPDRLPTTAIPGRWHVKRNNPLPALPSYIPITAPDGSYRDPDSRVPAELAEIDLRRPEVKERVLAETRTDSPQRAAERLLKQEQRRDELASHYRAARRTRGEGGLRKSFERKRSMK